MKKIYIVLAHTGTILSKIIKMKTGAEYTHSSIALDENLRKMYSFGRLHPYCAFIGGFVKEGATFGTFKRFHKTEISVYELEITDEQYQKVCDNIEYVRLHRKEYRFNILGLFLAGFDKKIESEKSFYCAEFVKITLEKSDIDTAGLPKVIKPEHFKNLKNAKLIYKGLLKEYKKTNKFKKYIHEKMLKKV
jgi:hypothetical protein